MLEERVRSSPYAQLASRYGARPHARWVTRACPIVVVPGVTRCIETKDGVLATQRHEDQTAYRAHHRGALALGEPVCGQRVPGVGLRIPDG